MALVPLGKSATTSAFLLPDDEEDGTPRPTFSEAAGAAFRQDNVVGSAIAGYDFISADNTVDPDYDFAKGVIDTEYEPYLDAFAERTFNQAQQEALKRRIDQELSDRRTLEAAGWTGLLASFGAAVFSPENLLPGGSIIKSAKLGRAMLKTGASAAAMGAGAAAIGEGALQATQEIRPGAESAFAIGGSALLSGILGAGVGAAVGRENVLKYAAKLDTEVNAPKISVGDAGTSAGKAVAAGAQAVAQDSIEDLGAAAGAGKSIANLGGNPLLRLIKSPSLRARQTLSKMFENSIYLKKNMEGEASDAAVETLVKEFTRGRLAKALTENDTIYTEFRKAGGTASKSEFRESVGKAMRRADTNENEFVSRAAQMWRSEIFDPLKKHAIDAGLLPEDVHIDTALSYFSRVYNRLNIEANEGEFKAIVSGWLDDVIRQVELKAEEIDLGKKVIAANDMRDKLRATEARMANVQNRLQERSARRGVKLQEIKIAEKARADAVKARAPKQLAKLINESDGGKELVAAVKEGKAAERQLSKRKTMAEQYPIVSMIKSLGGIRKNSVLAREAMAMGVTPKRFKGLFKTGTGLRDVDNIVARDHSVFDSGFKVDQNGYVDRQAILDALDSEMRGNPVMGVDQIIAEQNAAAVADEAQSFLARLGLPEDAKISDVRKAIADIVAKEQAVESLDTRIPRLVQELDDFDRKSDAFLDEESLTKAEIKTITDELDKIEKEVEQLGQYANESPRIKIMVDYAGEQRALWKAKAKERPIAARVQRLLDAEKRGDLSDDMAAELTAKEADLKAIQAEIAKRSAKVDKLKPMLPDPKNDIPSFATPDDRAEYIKEIAQDIFNKVTGRIVDEELPRDIVVSKRGPLAERTFNIPDQLIEKFLESDVEAVGRRYTRMMAADIELKRAFGDVTLKDDLAQVGKDYIELRGKVEADKSLSQPAKEKALKRLRRMELQDIKDIQAGRDMLRGTYLARENSTKFARAASALGTVNYMRALGGVTLSSMTDVGKHIMVHGLSGVYQDAIKPLMHGLKGIRMQVAEARELGAVVERVLNTRLATWAEIIDPYSYGSPFERFLDNSAKEFSKLNLLVYWNDFQKSVASMMTQSRILRTSLNYAKASKKDKAYLAFLGIDEDMAGRIAKQFAKHGEEIDGVRVAHSGNWVDDELAARLYRAAVNKDVDSVIVTKGIGDVPLWTHTSSGRLVSQFKSFALASHQRTLIRGLQEDKANFILGATVSTAIGMMVAYLKAVEANRIGLLSDNPGYWIAEGLDRSGIFSVAFEVNNAMEKGLNIGAYRALQALFPGQDQKGKASRYATRSTAAALAGPTADFIDTTVRVLRGVTDGDLTEGDVNAIRRLAPGATLPMIKSLVEYMIMPAAREAVRQ